MTGNTLSNPLNAVNTANNKLNPALNTNTVDFIDALGQAALITTGGGLQNQGQFILDRDKNGVDTHTLANSPDILAQVLNNNGPKIGPSVAFNIDIDGKAGTEKVLASRNSAFGTYNGPNNPPIPRYDMSVVDNNDQSRNLTAAELTAFNNFAAQNKGAQNNLIALGSQNTQSPAGLNKTTTGFISAVHQAAERDAAYGGIVENGLVVDTDKNGIDTHTKLNSPDVFARLTDRTKGDLEFNLNLDDKAGVEKVFAKRLNNMFDGTEAQYSLSTQGANGVNRALTAAEMASFNSYAAKNKAASASGVQSNIIAASKPNVVTPTDAAVSYFGGIISSAMNVTGGGRVDKGQFILDGDKNGIDTHTKANSPDLLGRITSAPMTSSPSGELNLDLDGKAGLEKLMITSQHSRAYNQGPAYAFGIQNADGTSRALTQAETIALNNFATKNAANTKLINVGANTTPVAPRVADSTVDYFSNLASKAEAFTAGGTRNNGQFVIDGDNNGRDTHTRARSPDLLGRIVRSGPQTSPNVELNFNLDGKAGLEKVYAERNPAFGIGGDPSQPPAQRYTFSLKDQAGATRALTATEIASLNDFVNKNSGATNLIDVGARRPARAALPTRSEFLSLNDPLTIPQIGNGFATPAANSVSNFVGGNNFYAFNA